MKLWLLERQNIHHGQYDVNDGFVVRAANEPVARLLANAARSQEGAIWLNCELSTCEQLTEDGPSEIILCDHHAG